MDSLPQAYRITLGHENSAFFNAYVYARHLFRHFVIQESSESDCADLQLWYQDVPIRAELGDETGCPICYSDYEFLSEITTVAPSDSRPVKLSCNHIMCFACLQRWATSDTCGSDKCLTCRNKMPPNNLHEEYLEVYASNISLAWSIDPDSPYQTIARLTIEASTAYLSQLPNSITGVCDEDIKCGPGALFYLWRSDFVSPNTSNPLDFDYGLTRLTPILKFLNAMSWTALHYLHWSSERLRAFLTGDAALFRKACESQLYCYARIDSLKLIISCLRL
jgi:hypothetical protein